MRTATLLSAVSLLLFSLACGGSIPALQETEPRATPAEPAPAEGVEAPAPTEAAEAPAPDRPAATPAPAAGAKTAVPAGDREYPGTFTGVCQRIDDCGCNPYASVEACAKSVEDSNDGALALAQEMGVDADGMLETVAGEDYLEEALYAQANASCAVACEGAPTAGGTTAAAPTAGGTTAAAPTAGSTLVIRSLDDEWVDIRVDGATVMELQSAEGTHTLSPGQHVVEVIEFASDDVVSTVRVYAGEVPEIVVGVREDGAARCYDPGYCQVQ